MTADNSTDETGAVRGIHEVVDETRWILRVLYSSVERFYWDNGFTKAASLAYTSLLSIIPFFTLGFGMIAAFAAGDYAHKVQAFIFRHFVPDENVANEIISLLNNLSNTLTSVSKSPMMIGFFILTSLLLINAIESALNDTWQVFEPRPIVQRIGIFSTIILLAPAIALSGYIFMEATVLPAIGWARELTVLNLLVPFLLAFFAFVFLNYFVPKAPVTLKSALFGGGITAVLFMISYSAFAIYLSMSSYYVVYSTVAAIPIFLVWLYLIWIVILFGSECAYQAQYLPRHGTSWARSVHSIGDGRVLLVTQALLLITRKFVEGKSLPDGLALAEHLGCSSVILKPALDQLEDAGIIMRGESRQKRISLMRSPELITLGEVLQALTRGRGGVRYARESAQLFRCFVQGKEDTSFMELLEMLGDPEEATD